MSELLDKVNILGKNNATLLKTVEAQQQSINHLVGLESLTNELKEELTAVKKVNKSLKSKNVKVEKTLNEFEIELKQIKQKQYSAVNILEDGTRRDQGTQTSKCICSCKITGGSVAKDKPGAAPYYKLPTENITFSPAMTPKPNKAEPVSTQVSTAKSCSTRDSNSKNRGSTNITPTPAEIGIKMPKTHSTVPAQITDKSVNHDVLREDSSATSIPERENQLMMKNTNPRQNTGSSAPLIEEPAIIEGVSKSETKSTRDYNYVKKHCLIVHDGTHDDFDQAKFSSRYDVDRLRIQHLSKMARDTDKIAEKILKSKYEMVILHAGHRDLWRGDKVQQINENYRHLINQLAQKTKVKICVSQIIPTGNYYPGFDEEVKKINEFVSSLISDLRACSEYDNRIFTANNDKLGKYVTRSTGPSGIQMSINSRGKNILWLKLRDGIERSLNKSQRGRKEAQQHSHDSTGRLTYRRENHPIRNTRNNG